MKKISLKFKRNKEKTDSEAKVGNDSEKISEKTEDRRFGKKKTVIIAVSSALLVLALAAALTLIFARVSLSLNGEEALCAPLFEEYTDAGAVVKYLGIDISRHVRQSSDVNTDAPGEYSVVYSLDWLGRHYEIARAVMVEDCAPPEITLEGETELILSDMRFFKEPGFSAVDRCDGDVTDKVSVKIRESGENMEVVYTASDSAGNTAEAVRKIEIRDVIQPTITLKGETEITVSVPDFADPGYSAEDDLDGDITERVEVTSDYKPKTQGDFVFKYTVSDKAGNKAEAWRTLHVKDTVVPVIKLNGWQTVSICQGDSYTDAGAAASDAFDGDLTASLSVSNTVDTSVQGSYSIVYTVSDSSGNTAEATRAVNVYPRPAPASGMVRGGGIVSDSTIYLTFDDGPSSKVTPQILDILKQNNVKATFFIVNYSDMGKGVIARAIAEGHTIAIHGYSHEYSAIYASENAFINNIDTLRQKLSDDFGYNTNIIRFPGGSSNAVSKKYCSGIMTRLAPLVESLGYTYFDWNISSGDAAGGTTPAYAITDNVTRGLRRGRGNVVLMHDTNAKGTTAAALQDIINYGYNNGYTFAALSSDTPPVHNNINN